MGIHKLVKKAHGTKSRQNLAIGVKAVQKTIRKGGKGVMIMAGDVDPIDSYSHIPVLCEESDISYIFTPSQRDLATARGSQGSLMLCLIAPADDYRELYDEVLKEVKTYE